MWTKEMKQRVREMIRYYHKNMEDKGFPVKPIRKVKYLRALQTFGNCENHNNKEVTIGISEVCYNGGEYFLKRTILHELCHACCKIGVHHGYVWQSYAERANRIYGVDITRTNSYTETQKAMVNSKYKYEVTCNHCGATWKYIRKTKFIKALIDNGAKSWYCNCGASDFTLHTNTKI